MPIGFSFMTEGKLFCMYSMFVVLVIRNFTIENLLRSTAICKGVLPQLSLESIGALFSMRSITILRRLGSSLTIPLMAKCRGDKPSFLVLQVTRAPLFNRHVTLSIWA